MQLPTSSGLNGPGLNGSGLNGPGLNGNGNGKLFEIIVKIAIPAMLGLSAWLGSTVIGLSNRQAAMDVKLLQLDRIERKLDRIYDRVTGFDKTDK